MVHFRAAHLLGRPLPAWSRERVFEAAYNELLGDYLTAQAFGHTGYTGTSIWMDPELDLWVVLLTNRVHPTRANQKHVPLRRAVHDAVVLSITDRTVERRENR